VEQPQNAVAPGAAPKAPPPVNAKGSYVVFALPDKK
jgi:hypothetical protein